MGKQYYCDFCERSFADGAENRKKHLISVHHQKLRKAHYEMFKDAATILEEDRLKKPCRKFHSGYCEFGTVCKYSHLTTFDVQDLEEKVSQEQLGVARKKLCMESDIEAWLQAKMLKIDKSSDNISAHMQQTVLPSVLSNIPNLPPSLIPSKASELSHGGKVTAQQWG